MTNYLKILSKFTISKIFRYVRNWDEMRRLDFNVFFEADI